VARLLRTCPRYTYTGVDINYTNKIYCLTWIKIHFNWLYESYCSKIELLESHITFAELLFEAISITKEECQQKIKMFKVDWFNHISSLKDLYQGFTEFL